MEKYIMTVSLCDLSSNDLMAVLNLTLSDEEQDISQLGSIDQIFDDLLAKEATPKLIHVEETIVGLLSYSVSPDTRSAILYHLLIGSNYRKRGYAKDVI